MSDLVRRIPVTVGRIQRLVVSIFFKFLKTLTEKQRNFSFLLNSINKKKIIHIIRIKSIIHKKNHEFIQKK
jgi:hypothetical protein